MTHLVHGLLVVLLALTTALPLGARELQAGPPVPLDEQVARLGAFDYDVRTRAARLLRRLPAAEAVPVLSAAARSHEDEFVRYRALVLLTSFNDRGTAALMRELLTDHNDRVREVVYHWFEQHPDPTLIPSLLAALQRESAEFVRPALISALAALGDDPQVQRALLFETGRGMDFFRTAVVEVLGRYRATYAIDAIADAARQPGPLQYDAVLALGRMRDRRVVPVLDSLRDVPPDVMVARSAALCLAADRCETHLAEAVRVASAPAAPRPVIRAAVTALAVVALDDDDLRAPSLLFELGTTVDGLRDDAARGLAIVALRGHNQLLAWLDRIPQESRGDALALVQQGVVRMDDDYRKEQLFIALRSAYWGAAEASSMREVAGALIEALEF